VNTATRTPEPPVKSTPPTNNGKRRLSMTLLVIVILIAAIAYGLYYLLVARFYEDTDDAYVNGNVVQITPQVTGTVISVNADDTQTVKAGDPLVVLDPADARVALQRAEANLAQTVRQVRGLFAKTAATRQRLSCVGPIWCAPRTICAGASRSGRPAPYHWKRSHTPVTP
jgi:membrane fusion protein (multidrug efflux system)